MGVGDHVLQARQVQCGCSKCTKYTPHLPPPQPGRAGRTAKSPDLQARFWSAHRALKLLLLRGRREPREHVSYALEGPALCGPTTSGHQGQKGHWGRMLGSRVGGQRRRGLWRLKFRSLCWVVMPSVLESHVATNGPHGVSDAKHAEQMGTAIVHRPGRTLPFGRNPHGL